MTFNDFETNMRPNLLGFSHSSCSDLKKKYHTCCAHSSILDFIEEKLQYVWHFATLGQLRASSPMNSIVPMSAVLWHL